MNKTSTAVEKVKEKVVGTKIMSVFDFMKDKKDLIAEALPKHIGVERMIAMFTIVIRSNPELLQCSQTSLIGALVQTVQLGLIPGNVNHCYYVPFNNKQKDGSYQREVQFILGYKGMVELVNRSKVAAILSTEVVYDNDSFEYSLGLNPTLRHIPTQNDRGNIKGVYCVAKNLMAGEKLFIYIPQQDIEKVKNASKAKDSDYSPWNKWPAEMSKKTAIKRMCKLLPLSIDVQKKLSADETVKTKISGRMVDEIDETNWEDAELSESKGIEQQPQEDGQTEWEKEEAQNAKAN